MKYHLNLDWRGTGTTETEGVEARLLPFENKKAGTPQTALVQDQGQRFRFEDLNSGNYLLSFRYVFKDKHFDSFYFHIQVPDTTLIQVSLLPTGCQIDEMGFLNDYGEFVDMLVYEDQKPFLTHAVEENAFFQSLADYLAFKHSQTPAKEAQDILNALLGDLSKIYPTLTQLWSYQLKALIQPPLLVKTSAQWKACLMQLWRNNLILMDNEGLHENLQEAIEFSQQETEVETLLDYMDWDIDTNDWINQKAFLEALSGQSLLKN